MGVDIQSSLQGQSTVAWHTFECLPKSSISTIQRHRQPILTSSTKPSSPSHNASQVNLFSSACKFDNVIQDSSTTRADGEVGLIFCLVNLKEEGGVKSCCYIRQIVFAWTDLKFTLYHNAKPVDDSEGSTHVFRRLKQIGLLNIPVLVCEEPFSEGQVKHELDYWEVVDGMDFLEFKNLIVS
ncbi:hypothetical protein L208DRAFT_1375167 [Tricholoma matsutake]|nr:hypothetical protein L208DRAFT_1375167 [Tricholoma matsutake 945]